MRITAECAVCAWRYDATQGLECPHCHGTGIRWAFREPDDDPYAVVDRLRAISQQEWYIPGAIETPFPPDQDLAELERMWALTEYNPH